ncbi:MAG: TM2 domain-containing protein [Bacilli bacterium]|jgi:TM2 domain protein|nr:TM2 domain-containing protein [Staphylococcus sp.]CDC68741.1 tM2 domain protein [Staphylococcus sp. CAG:324]
MKYCSKCGKECQDNASFCENCGQKLTFQNLSSIEYSDKSKLACGLLQIFLGGLGVGRFYSGHTGIAIAQILVTIFTFGIGSIWGLIDGIVILCNDKFTDSKGKMMKD